MFVRDSERVFLVRDDKWQLKAVRELSLRCGDSQSWGLCDRLPRAPWCCGLNIVLSFFIYFVITVIRTNIGVIRCNKTVLPLPLAYIFEQFLRCRCSWEVLYGGFISNPLFYCGRTQSVLIVWHYDLNSQISLISIQQSRGFGEKQRAKNICMIQFWAS